MRANLDVVRPDDLVSGMGRRLVSGDEPCGNCALPEIHAGAAPPCQTFIVDTGIDPQASRGGFQKRPMPAAVDVINSFAPSVDQNVAAGIQKTTDGFSMDSLTAEERCLLCHAAVMSWFGQYVEPPSQSEDLG